MIPKSIGPISHYVNDFSGVLSETSQHELNEFFASIDTESSLQVVTVIFPHREGLELRDIALDVFNSNGIGQKGKNNGLLLVISSDEKKIRIMTGKGLEWIYSDTWCRNTIEKKLRALMNVGKYEELIRVWHEEVKKRNIEGKKIPNLSPGKMIGGFFGLFYGYPFIIIFSSAFLINIGFFSGLILLLLVSIGAILLGKKFGRWFIFFVTITFCILLFIIYQSEKNTIFCKNNPEICEQRKIESQNNSSSSYKSSSSSSSSSWGSSSSSSSSSSFGGGGGSSNGGGYGD